MKSDEDQIINTYRQILEALAGKDFEKLERFITDDSIFNISYYPPMIGKKSMLEHYYAMGPLDSETPSYEKITSRSQKIKVSNMGDLANMWAINNLYNDGNLVVTVVNFSGWIKINGVWLIESSSDQVVETGWTWEE